MAPRAAWDSGQEVLAFGRFYVRELDAAHFRLAWYAAEPDFAIPTLTADEEDALVQRVVSLIRDGPTQPVVTAHFGALHRDSELDCDVATGPTWTLQACPAGAARPDHLSLSFRRPLTGAAVASALGLVEPVVVATDVHMVTRYLRDWRRQRFPWWMIDLARGSRGRPLARGYEVNVEVPAEDLEATELHWGGSPVWRAPTLRISLVEFSRWGRR